MEGQTAEQVLQKLQDELNSLELRQTAGQDSLDLSVPPPSKGSGPRLFCGHVPKEATEDLVKAHFSQWGIVTDVYFPRHKKTLKRRPFCFVTFLARDSAERALAESPLNICGIPIKNLTMVEDRDKYYKEKHHAAQQALLGALSSLGAGGVVPPDQINNIASVLAMEGISVEALMANLLPQVMSSHIARQQPGGANASSYNTPQRHNSLGGGGSGPADFILQQQHQQQQRIGDHQTFSPVATLRGSASTGQGQLLSSTSPLQQHKPFAPASQMPGAATFPSMMHRDSSMSSLSSQQSDWFSTTSSARNSLDHPPAFHQFQGAHSVPQMHGGGGGQQGQGPLLPGQLSNGRLSMDAAVQLRQQLFAAANANAFHWMNAQQGAATMLPPKNSSHNNAAAALQSAFYQPTIPPSLPGASALNPHSLGVPDLPGGMPSIRECRSASMGNWPASLSSQGMFVNPSSFANPIAREIDVAVGGVPGTRAAHTDVSLPSIAISETYDSRASDNAAATQWDQVPDSRTSSASFGAAGRKSV